MHLLLVSADRALSDPLSPAFARHAGYAALLAARVPGARLSVLLSGCGARHAAGPMRVCGVVPAGPIDAVTAQNPWSAAAWRVALARRVPFLAQLHFDPFAPAMRGRARLARLAVGRAARLRVMAPATAEAVVRHWRIPAGSLWVAPVPIAWPQAAPAMREALVVGAMRLAPDRAPETWIAAAAAIARARPGVRFVLAGDGPHLARLRAMAAGLPVQLPGALTHDALAPLLARARLFLHTAPHEAFGRAMAEAQAAGLPVVARATTGAEAIVADGRTGLLAQAADTLVGGALALLDDPARAAAMGEETRRVAAARFSPADMQACVVDFLLGERPCSTSCS